MSELSTVVPPAGPMGLGAALALAPIGGGPLGPRTLATNARRLEELGYTSLWVFDGIGRGFMLPDPLQALTVAATVTDRVELGTGVLQLPIRNPPEVAHRALTLTLLSGGRFLFGVGPGSSAPDFETMGAGASFDRRFAHFDRQLNELRSWLTTGGFEERSLHPWPEVAGGPPLVLAGWRGRWIERAAREADAWIASGAYADDAALADGIARYRQAGGRRAIVTNVQVGPDLAPTIDRLHRLAALGFDDAVVFDLTPTGDRLAAVRAALPA